MAGQIPQRNETGWERELRQKIEQVVYKKLIKAFDGAEVIYKVGYVTDGGPVEEDWLYTYNVVDYIVNDIVNAIKAMVSKEYEGCLEISDEDIQNIVREINDKYNLGLWLC